MAFPRINSITHRDFDILLDKISGSNPRLTRLSITANIGSYNKILQFMCHCVLQKDIDVTFLDHDHHTIDPLTYKHLCLDKQILVYLLIASYSLTRLTLAWHIRIEMALPL